MLIATVASVAVLIAWQFLFPAPKPKPVAPRPAEVAQPARPPEGMPATPAPAGQPAPVAVPTNAPEELVHLDGAGFNVVLTSHGGAVKEIVLEGDKFRRAQQGGPVQIDLVRVAKGQPYPLATVATPEAGGAQ